MTATVGGGGRTGRTFAEVYGTGKPIPDDEIAEWLADAEDYIPKLRAAGHEPMARFLVAAYLIIRQLQDGVAEALENLAGRYPANIFPADGTSRDAISGTALRTVLTAQAKLHRDGTR